MTTIRVNPVYELARELERMFYSPNYTPRKASIPEPSPSPATVTPAIQVWETSEAYIIKAILPSVARESLNIEASTHEISVKGQMIFGSLDQAKLHHADFRDQSVAFSRSLKLPQGIQPEAVVADYQDGVLTLTLPKTDVVKTVKVQLHGNGHQPISHPELN